jgi:hypothetical protein
MTDRHAQNPISIRPPRDDRAWLESYARQAGRPVRAIIVEAIARERARQEGRTMDTDTRLTLPDRSVILRAEILAATPPDGNCAYTGISDDVTAAAYALGQAKDLLGELAAIIARLDGHG